MNFTRSPLLIMLVVGLTGGISTGKSTVSAMLKAHNVPVIDADVIARQVVQPNTRALRQITRAFGHEILLPDGTLDRKKLGSIVFNDEGKRKELNAIVHPAVRLRMLWEVVVCWLRGEKWCVLDVPLLIEGGLWRCVGLVVVVYCSAEIQLVRLMARDGSGREDAGARLNAQMAIARKIGYAEVVIDNSGTRAELERQVAAFVQRVEDGISTPRWLLCWLLPPLGLLSAAWTLLRRLCR